MKKPKLVVLAFALLAFTMVGSVAYAQAVVANIDFPFKAGKTTFPAGKYSINQSPEEELTIRSMDTGKGVIVPFTTRLSPREDNAALVVFDKDGDQYYLSEIYMPGIDGFALTGAPGKHTHVKVKGGNK